MTYVLIIIGVIVGLLILNLLLFKGDYTVTVSKLINRPPSKVFSTVADFRSWSSWSPWMQHEPTCSIEYSKTPTPSEVGGHYSWNGNVVNAGKMTHLELDQPNKIISQLNFIKPFKSICKVIWNFKAEQKGTSVTWRMEGSMPFLFRFMTAKMPKYISKRITTAD